MLNIAIENETNWITKKHFKLFSKLKRVCATFSCLAKYWNVERNRVESQKPPKLLFESLRNIIPRRKNHARRSRCWTPKILQGKLKVPPGSYPAKFHMPIFDQKRKSTNVAVTEIYFYFVLHILWLFLLKMPFVKANV